MGYRLFCIDKKGDKNYYMNVIMITEDQESAEVFSTVEEAESNMDHFKRMFFYEDVTPMLEET